MADREPIQEQDLAKIPQCQPIAQPDGERVVGRPERTDHRHREKGRHDEADQRPGRAERIL
jgi:hypothetical protein